MKTLRQQQESALEDILRQKNESLRTIAEEKVTFEKYCDDTKQAALKDRRLAAKLLRDAKEKLTSGAGALPASIRNAKQEIDVR